MIAVLALLLSALGGPRGLVGPGATPVDAGEALLASQEICSLQQSVTVPAGKLVLPGGAGGALFGSEVASCWLAPSVAPTAPVTAVGPACSLLRGSAGGPRAP